MRRWQCVVGLLALLIPTAVRAEDETAHFYFAGPMSRFMVEGAVPGVRTSGLPFTLTMTNGGASIAPAQYDLKGPQWSGSAGLSFDGLKFAAGHLTATIRLKNGSGSVLEGLRLDILGATEEYRAKDAAGNPLLQTRPQNAALASPLLLGDLAKDEESDAVELDVSGLTFPAETTRITVHGVVSGLYYLGAFNDGNSNCVPVALDLDAMGRVYLADRNDSAIYRTDPDGKNPIAVTKLPDAARDVAVSPTTGDIVTKHINTHFYLVFSAGGEDKGKIEGSDWSGWARFDAKGRLFGTFGNTIYRIQDSKPQPLFDRAGDYEFGGYLAFDVDGSDAFWVADKATLFKVAPDTKSSKRIAFGPDWHLGRLQGAQAVRVDQEGNVYVVEEEMNAEWNRISVFDRNGKFIRIFGRGGKTVPSGDTKRWPGQVAKGTYDLAFGRDGRIYVAIEDTTDSVLMFRQF